MSSVSQKGLFSGPVQAANTRSAKSSTSSTVKGKLRVHDPFELIRWLALSQPDPRKALAELVQNSLDAGARSIRVIRVRLAGVATLRIIDDGEGVIPELSRRDALHYVATNIGHSRKRSLSPQERYELMTQGQYGIGLLGFWSLGQRLEIRTSTPGEKPLRLILHRNQRDFRIEAIRGRLPLEGSYTEVRIGDLLPEAQRVLSCRRASDYLGTELRGQLLGRDVELLVEDRMARGRAPKLLSVEPPKYLGPRLDLPLEIEMRGFPPALVEVHLRCEEGEEPIVLYAAGTRVCDSFTELGGLELDRAPWTDKRLTGHVDFPALSVAPGSRRGVLPDAASLAFDRGLAALEPLVFEILAELELNEQEKLDRRLVKDLRRAFRGLFDKSSRFTLLPVASDERSALPLLVGENGGTSAVSAVPVGQVVDLEEVGSPPAGIDDPPTEVEPGPLSQLETRPKRPRIPVDSVQRLRTCALDDAGRSVREVVDLLFRLDSGLADLIDDADGQRSVLIRAGDQVGSCSLRIIAVSSHREVALDVPVEITEAAGRGDSDEGIPEPKLVDAPGMPWRSRLVDGQWEVNVAHPDYRSVLDRPVLKVRYLALLFAKEVILRSYQDPRLETPLEQLVEVAFFADRNLAARRK